MADLPSNDKIEGFFAPKLEYSAMPDHEIDAVRGELLHGPQAPETTEAAESQLEDLKSIGGASPRVKCKIDHLKAMLRAAEAYTDYERD